METLFELPPPNAASVCALLSAPHQARRAQPDG